jgi:hypothetical protein
MRIRLRPGGRVAVALGALLLLGLLAAPASAQDQPAAPQPRDWGVDVEPSCLDDGTIKVDWTVHSDEGDREADVVVTILVDDEPFGDQIEGAFGPRSATITGSFEIPDGAESAKVRSVVTWTEDEVKEGKIHRVLFPSCEPAPAPAPAPSTPTTPTTAPSPSVLATTRTTAGEVLPFTGNGSGPTALAGIGLVGGGLLILFASRTRGRHVAGRHAAK